MSRPPARRDAKPIEWNFFSFPVLAAFCFGIFVATLIAPFLLSGFAYTIFFWLSLFAVSFCMAHVMTHWFHGRSLEKKLQRAEEDERERRALAARAAAARGNEVTSRRRRRRGGGASSQ